MIITRKAVARRTFLRGVGATVALPFLDSMVPALATAATTPKPPVRMAFAYVPNGLNFKDYKLGYEGKLDKLSRILQPLEPYKQDINVLGNLTHNAGRALLDGPGDHGRCSASYLTGMQPRKTMSDIKAGVSFDQIVGQHVGAGPASIRWSSASKTPARRATAIRATPALTPTIWRGAPSRSRCRRRSIRARYSNASSATMPRCRPKPAAAAISIGAACSIWFRATPNGCRRISGRPISASSTNISPRSARSNCSRARRQGQHQDRPRFR